MNVRAVIVNPTWHSRWATPHALLDGYRSLTGWAEAVAAAGIDVAVVQRWSGTVTLQRHGVTYDFVADGEPPVPHARASVVAAAVAHHCPDIVHINGVVFPRWTRALLRACQSHVRSVVQDHGGWHPQDASLWARRRIRAGLAGADAVLVSSAGQVAIWRARGVLPPNGRAFTVMEASTDFRPQPTDRARVATGLGGDPAVLMVGRLTAAKNPLVVLDGFARFARTRPGSHLTIVGAGGELEAEVRRRVDATRNRVTMIGAVPHTDLESYLSAADLFISGSVREGSGYAALEAMACGAIPVLTTIPSFDAMTGGGNVGERWEPGDTASCASALDRAAAACGPDVRKRVRTHFEANLSWPAIGRRAAKIYRLVAAR